VTADRLDPRRPEQPPERLWTRVGTLAHCAHAFYELASGVGMPLASRVGPAPSAALFGGGSLLLIRGAGRQPRSRDPAFAVANAMFLSAVLAHLTGWPRTRVAGLPWLIECEGLSGRLMVPYNLVLYTSGVAAIGGLVETGRDRPWRTAAIGAAVPAVLVPWLIQLQHDEHDRLRAQARRRPRWWNRRLRRP
jgi:hypothetical protein